MVCFIYMSPLLVSNAKHDQLLPPAIHLPPKNG